MKKLLLAITMLVYFAMSTGVAISLHYCMDQLRSVQLGDVHTDRCGQCGMHQEENNGCCKDELQVVKLTVSHPAPQALIADFSLNAALLLSPTPLFDIQLPDNPEKVPSVAHSPPLLPHQDIYLRNCVFRI